MEVQWFILRFFPVIVSKTSKKFYSKLSKNNDHNRVWDHQRVIVSMMLILKHVTPEEQYLTPNVIAWSI